MSVGIKSSIQWLRGIDLGSSRKQGMKSRNNDLKTDKSDLNQQGSPQIRSLTSKAIE